MSGYKAGLLKALAITNRRIDEVRALFEAEGSYPSQRLCLAHSLNSLVDLRDELEAHVEQAP
jgi:hypothetical protein